LPDNAGVVDAISELTTIFPTRDQKLEKMANDKLSIRFLQLNEAIQSSVSNCVFSLCI
jgi:c-di-GMP-binding flagellar brake protein YcgR